MSRSRVPIAAPMARRVAAHDRAQHALEDRQRVVSGRWRSRRPDSSSHIR